MTTPSGHAGTPIAPAALADALGWSLERLTTTLAVLTEYLAGTGIRIDTDPHPPARPSGGLRARDRHLSEGQRAALHRLRHATAPLDAGAAWVLYAVAHPRGTLTEGDAAGPATVVALQQRGIIRRRTPRRLPRAHRRRPVLPHARVSARCPLTFRRRHLLPIYPSLLSLFRALSTAT